MPTYEPRCPAKHPDLPYSRCALDEEHVGTHRNFAGNEWADAPDLMDGGVTCAAIENETNEKPTAYWEGIYRGLRDDADNARTMAALWKETAREHIGRAEVYQEWMCAAQGKAECHDCIRDAAVIERPRALTAREHLDAAWEAAHAHTHGVKEGDQFLQRFDNGKIVTGLATWTGVPIGNVRLLDPPEPQRPEGAEDIAALLDHMPADLIGGPLTAHEARTLADHLAEHGVRVTTEESR